MFGFLKGSNYELRTFLDVTNQLMCRFLKGSNYGIFLLVII